MNAAEATKIAKSNRPFAAVFEYSTSRHAKGEILSTHKSYDLARKAIKASGYETFLAVRDCRDYA